MEYEEFYNLQFEIKRQKHILENLDKEKNRLTSIIFNSIDKDLIYGVYANNSHEEELVNSFFGKKIAEKERLNAEKSWGNKFFNDSSDEEDEEEDSMPVTYTIRNASIKTVPNFQTARIYYE